MEGGLKRFFEGSWQEAQSLLGAHRTAEGWCFRVYAPNARSVRVAGDFSDWQGLAMNRWPEGIWETTVPQAQVGQSYKYVVEGADGRTRWKADPYGVYSQLRPANASRLWDTGSTNRSEKAYTMEKVTSLWWYWRNHGSIFR